MCVMWVWVKKVRRMVKVLIVENPVENQRRKERLAPICTHTLFVCVFCVRDSKEESKRRGIDSNEDYFFITYM